jgi:tellurite resistance protein
MRHVKAIPLNLFGVPFGLAGLAEAWLVLAGQHHAPALVGEIVLLVSAGSWLLVAAAYVLAVARRPSPWSALRGDLLHPVAAPFASLAVITPMLLASLGLFRYGETPGRVVTDVFIALTVLLGGWFTGQWIYGPLDVDRFHPGYFLPTVAGGLVAAAAAATVGQPLLAQVLFGLGVLCWIVLGSVILGRLLFRPPLPAALQPTLAIEVAPAAVASLAWFAMHGEHLDAVVAFLGGYGLLMVLAQLRLLPAYRRLSFSPGLWAFTFSSAAVTAVALIWLELGRPSGYRVWQYTAIAAVSLLVGGIAVRTLVAVWRGDLLPAPPTGDPVAGAADPGGRGEPGMTTTVSPGDPRREAVR